MEALIYRTDFTLTSTISDFSIDGGPRLLAFLEDRDRGLDSVNMSLSELKARKVQNETAIGIGRYRIKMRFSPHMQCFTPHLLDVPAYQYVLQHIGNDAGDTDACQLPGLTKEVDRVLSSKIAFGQLMGYYRKINPGEEIFLTVARDPVAWAAFIKQHPLPIIHL